MEQEQRVGTTDLLAGLGRHWGLVLTFGVLNLLVGLLVLLWPGRTLVVVAVLFGLELIAAGILRFVAAFGEDERGATRVLLMLLGVLSTVVGAVVLFRPGPSLLTLAVALGVWLLVFGAMEVARAFQLRSSTAPAAAHIATDP
jgi:uncharacterized membrane protein HdeD (DUF308 family)